MITAEHEQEKLLTDAVSKSQTANALSKEKSPYLLQHAYNPVAWYPWGPLAFEKAQQENKPIFLSVGYSTCHWCHVMERESFENEEIARFMNENFINIKVDREERPDVDRVYMTFVQATTGSGGWPMSVWLTPDLKPFLGGTYFPPRDLHGRKGFLSILKSIAERWKINQDKFRASGSHVMHLLKALTEVPITSKPSKRDVLLCSLVINALSYFESIFDPNEGGFGNAPKFPTPVILRFLLTFAKFRKPICSEFQLEKVDEVVLKKWCQQEGIPFSTKEDTIPRLSKHILLARTQANSALNMALLTLKKMASGGIHDHIGQGFHRYSTDEYWHLPHFEKMLYDQAQLLSTYLIAYQVSGDGSYAEIAKDIVEYVTRNLRCETHGAFFSAEDADSLPTTDATEKKEGAFAVWTMEEVKELLSEKEAEIFCAHYGLKDKGNILAAKDPHGELTGKNVLFERLNLEEAAMEFNYSVEEMKSLLQQCRQKLFHARQQRPKPHLDDKIVTSWNGLMISGLARAARTFDPVLIESLQPTTSSATLTSSTTSPSPTSLRAMACQAAEFFYHHMYDPEKKILLRSYRDGPSCIEGFAEDYAFFIQALLDLYETTFEDRWLQWACDLQSTQDALFLDTTRGGYFSASEKDPYLPIRLKDDHDGADPSSNSVSLVNLLRLNHFANNQKYFDTAETLINSFIPHLSDAPHAMPYFVKGILLYLYNIKQIIVAGNDQEKIRELLYSIHRYFIPNHILIYARPEGWLANQNPFLKQIGETYGNEKDPVVLICEHFTCSVPLRHWDQIEKALMEKYSLISDEPESSAS